MAREAVASYGSGMPLPKVLLRQVSVNTMQSEDEAKPVVNTLQSPLEFWLREDTPLLMKKEEEKRLPRPPPPPLLPSPDDIGSEESTWSIACQVFFPFLVAGFGTVAAGLLLDLVQHWDVFQAIPEMFILVPALLGLKGNLEMTLASRISTLANLGTIDTAKEQWKMALGNIALLQCQSLVLGLVAAGIAAVVGWIREGQLKGNDILLLCTSSLVTASVASLLLGSVTICVVVYSRKLNINPDNVAAPVSASLGDVITLGLLACISSIQFPVADIYRWFQVVIVVAVLFLIPFWALLAYHNKYTRQVLYTGWVPIISAVAISSGGGFILNFAVARFKEIAACQPVINGVGGNLVAVQACRISTFLHQRAKLGSLLNPGDLCVSPLVAWFGKNPHARTARILLSLSIPGHLLFISVVHLLKSNSTPFSFTFLMLYVTAALLQVALLLYIAHCLTHWLWRWRFDPDDAAIPYLTALGDLLGTGFLFLAFLAMEAI